MTNETPEPDEILSMTLSGIMEEIKSQEKTEPSPKNENALSINIVVAFWWVVNYIVESVVRNICNYLQESPGRYNISQEQEEYTEQRFKFNLIDMQLNEPVTFEKIEIGGNIPKMIEVN